MNDCIWSNKKIKKTLFIIPRGSRRRLYRNIIFENKNSGIFIDHRCIKFHM